MGNGEHDPGARYVRMLFDAGTVGGLTDSQLLERFTAQRGELAELAFATLVERHGPMVLRVCRSVLRDPEEAHDAFQATFLVLVRRSGSLWVRESLGPWLHQVAFRVASNARSAASRRRRHEQRAAALAGPGFRAEDHDDVGAVLHAEVNRLPSGCRSAVVLCYFDGLSPEQAARQLGCPVGTVQSRLARGRERLRSRLSRRGLAPALGALGAEAASQAAPVALAPSLVTATVQAALSPTAASAAASESVVQLAQGALRAMLVTKLRTAAVALVAVAALAVGAKSFIQDAPASRPPANVNLDQLRTELGAQARSGAKDQPPPDTETGPPPQDLNWADVAPADRLTVIEKLAALSRGNYEKIKTWRGVYSYVLRQHLDQGFVAQLGQAGQREGLTQEFDSVLTFAVDTEGNAIYRDIETRRMQFLRPGTDDEVKIKNVGPADHRSILTPERYLVFRPKDRATSAFLPDHPEAQMKRRVERFRVAEARMREGGSPDPREFFKFDPGNGFWTGMELYARAFRGELGATQKQTVEERYKIKKANGPGGNWYREEMKFENPGGSGLWVSTLWSPQAGYNPVLMIRTTGVSGDKPESTIEWRWKQIDGIYVPTTINETAYRGPGGRLSKEQRTRLDECVLNQPLDPHQFDELGLGLEEGDLVLDHLDRVGYIMKGGEIVKLARFGERSVLKLPFAKPSPSPRATRGPRPAAGKIYTTASLGTDESGRPISSVVAVDPETGDVAKVFDNSPGRLRVSPDGRSVAYAGNETSTNLDPRERMRQSVWLRSLGAGAAVEPKRLVRLDDGASAGALPVWSPDGKQLIVSVGKRDEERQRWDFETFRISAGGSDRQTLKLPAADGVMDWSPDGAWVVTASSRNAKIGWQLYVMHLDGTEVRQVTEGGNPYYARFSPDGRRLLYSDGTAKLLDRQGIWIVDVDGKNRRRVFPTGKDERASACWSPSGQQIAVTIGSFDPAGRARLEVVNLDGPHRTLLTLPGKDIADMPDWR